MHFIHSCLEAADHDAGLHPDPDARDTTTVADRDPGDWGCGGPASASARRSKNEQQREEGDEWIERRYRECESHSVPE